MTTPHRKVTHKTWWPDGKLKRIQTYESPDVYTGEEYDRDGNLIKSIKKIAGKTGKVTSVEAPKRNGVFTDFYPRSTAKQCRGPYKDGIRNGKFTCWHHDGTLKSVTHYIMNKEHGKSESWYYNGKKKDVVHWDRGKMINKTFWHADGTMAEKADFTQGTYAKWDIHGRLVAERTRQGHVVTGKSYDSSGNPKTIRIENEKEKTVAFEKYMGKRMLERTFSADTQVIERDSWWSLGGKNIEFRRPRDGNPGYKKAWYRNGDPMLIEEYGADEKLTSAKYFDKSGKSISKQELEKSLEPTAFEKAVAEIALRLLFAAGGGC